MHPIDPHGAPGGADPETVTLTSTVGAAQLKKMMIPLAVLLFVATWMVVALPVHGFHLPAANLITTVLAAAFVFGMWKYKMKDLDGARDKTTLTLSPEGLRRVDQQLVSEMPWSAVRGFERGNTLGSAVLPTGAGGSLASAFSRTAVTAAATAPQRVEVSLAGSGTIRRLPGLSPLRAKQVDQNYGIHDDETHESERLWMTLSHFEPDWRTGQIGRFLARYRPDLRIPETDDPQA